MCLLPAGASSIYQRDQIGAGPYRMSRSSTREDVIEGIVQKGQHESRCDLFLAMKLNLASVPRHQINFQRQSFERSKNTFTALPGRRVHSRLNALKIVCPNFERVVRSFIVMVQRGCGQLMDILLMGWWWCNRSQSPQHSGLNWSRVCILVGSIPSLIVNFFPPGGGFSICKTDQCKAVVCIQANQDLAPRLLFECSSLISASPPFPH